MANHNEELIAKMLRHHGVECTTEFGGVYIIGTDIVIVCLDEVEVRNAHCYRATSVEDLLKVVDEFTEIANVIYVD